MKCKKILGSIFIACLWAVLSYGASYQTAEELYIQGSFDEAEAETAALLEQSPQNLEYRKLLANIYMSQGRFEDARDASLAVLSRNQEDVESNLMIARIYSWMMEYDKSVVHYDKCLKLAPDDLTCLIEKARMLGWGNEFKDSLKTYEYTYDKYRQDWIYYEMQAKKALWAHRPDTAINNFDATIENKPDNSEAMLHLGQIYSYSTMYDEAVPYYKSVKNLSPYNTAAKESEYKNYIRRDDFHLRAGFDFWKADSDDRQTQVSRFVPFLSLSKYIAKNLMLTATANRGFYNYSSNPSIKQTGLLLNADYQKGFYYGFGAGYEFLDFSKGKTNHNYVAYAWYKLLERFNLSASYRQENVISNYNNIVNSLQTKYALLRAEYDISRTFLFGVDYRFGTYTDGNYFGVAGADLLINFTQAPKRLYTMFRAEDWNYRRGSANYFAPSSYNEYSGLIGFKHNITRRGLYYGAKEIYYDIKFRVGLNSNNETSYSPRVDFHMDFTPRIYFQAYLSLYEAVFYSDHTYGAMLGFYF